MIAIDRIAGMADKYVDQLFNIGIFTTRDLLIRASTREGRKTISLLTGIDEDTVLRWVQMADLMRINGVGPFYARLLEEAGIRSVDELAASNDRELYLKISRVNARLKMVKKIPTILQVRDWIRQARRMRSVVIY